ncbi:MAG: septal ring lytic transglycosylase RlpA family lipoprotein [Candidatus Hydrothermota bacterium]|nr:MAG: septal ring lytic transglycosylase RlpA family lipoprotein [Candidatus Hydrothermae bacterium]
MRRIFLISALIFLASCAPGGHQWVEYGIASWYGPGFHGRRTASGEVFDMYKLTAAHNHLPFGTIVEVTNLENGKKVTVRINDRGPHKRGRIIDLSYRAAQKIGLIGPGLARVRVRVLKWGKRP